MFEKEAEEYATNVFNPVQEKFCITRELVQGHIAEGFKEGAQFGYNFAKEEIDYLNKHWRSEEESKANEWHKPSEKLPEECSLVLAYLFEETEPTICEYVVSDQWECLPKRIVFCSNDQIRLWKEIVLPKEK